MVPSGKKAPDKNLISHPRHDRSPTASPQPGDEATPTPPSVQARPNINIGIKANTGKSTNTKKKHLEGTISANTTTQLHTLTSRRR